MLYAFSLIGLTLTGIVVWRTRRFIANGEQRRQSLWDESSHGDWPSMPRGCGSDVSIKVQPSHHPVRYR